MARPSRRTADELSAEIARLTAERNRYRRATAEAMSMLDWCIEIFHERPSHRKIARQLAENRASIRRRLSSD